MVYRLTVEKSGIITLPKTALEGIGVFGPALVKLSLRGTDLVLEKCVVQPAPKADRSDAL